MKYLYIFSSPKHSLEIINILDGHDADTMGPHTDGLGLPSGISSASEI